MKKIFLNFSKTNNLLEGNVSNFLDLIRGISAILVVNEHLSSRLLVGYGKLENPNALIKFLYLLNMLGNPAVIIFFVLSGLFISTSVINSLIINRWTWKTYLINRLSRLYVVLIPALILTVVLDAIASRYFGFHGYNNFGTFIGNLFFLQNIVTNVYGSNAPLWSLNYEFWYYILFPLIIMLFFRNQSKMSKTIYLALIVGSMFFIGFKMNTYFIIWLVGALIPMIPNIKFLTVKLAPLFAMFLVSIAFLMHPLVMSGRLFTHQWTDNPYILNLIIAVLFGFLIYTLLHNRAKAIKKTEYRTFGVFSKLLSSFSFSLYLIHYPIINTVYYLAAKNGFTGFQPNILSVILELLITLIICVIAFLFSKLTETKTNTVRKYFLNKVNQLKNVQNIGNRVS